MEKEIKPKKIRDIHFDGKRIHIWGDKVEHEGVRYRTFRLKLFEGSREIGHVKVLHYTLPFNFFYFSGIEIDQNLRYLSNDELAGYGGSVVRNINHFLNTRKGGQVGVLQDSVEIFNRNASKVHDMYYSHGWKDLGNNIHLVYEGRPITEAEKEMLLDLFHTET